MLTDDVAQSGRENISLLMLNVEYCDPGTQKAFTSSDVL